MKGILLIETCFGAQTLAMELRRPNMYVHDNYLLSLVWLLLVIVSGQAGEAIPQCGGSEWRDCLP